MSARHALADMLQCSSGGWSCMRITTVIVCVVVLSVWVGCCIAEGRWISPTWEMVTLIAGAQGAKAVQYRWEDHNDPGPDMPCPPRMETGEGRKS